MKSVLWGFILALMALFYFMSHVSAQAGGNFTGEKNVTLANIKVVLDHIFISQKNDSLEVSETVVFRNEGAEIYYSRDNHTFFAISTPSGVKNLKTEAMECCLVEEEGAVLMDPMQSIAPGENFEMKVSYALVPPGKEYVFNKTSLYNTTSLSIFVDKTGGMSAGGAHETLTLNGNDYYVVVFNDIKAGETVGVEVKLAESTSYLYAEMGLFFLFSIGLAYHFKEKLFRRRIESLEELELEKIRIFQAIHGLGKHARTESSGEFNKLMDEYKQKAIQIFIKIDKIKNKDEPELLKKTDDNAGLTKI